MKNPIQPLLSDKNGVVRFKENTIVRHLLDWATERGHGLNELAMLEFTDDDRQQFAQLIGYSLSGYGELRSYVDDHAYNTAALMTEPSNLPEDKARIAALQIELDEMRAAVDAMRSPLATLFGMHEDDLKA